MISKLIAVIVLITAVQKAQSAVVDELCKDCLLQNGAGYASHRFDCRKFIHCEGDMYGNVRGKVKQCAFPTYWNLKRFACVHVDDSSCPNDLCIGEMNGLVYGTDENPNCRGFWMCIKGVSTPMCCPPDHRFTMNGLCQRDENCRDQCFDSGPLKEVKCNKQAMPGRPGSYLEYDFGTGWRQRTCGPGTAFNKTTCGCGTFDSSTIHSDMTCVPEVFIPFTTNHRDESVNGHYVRQQNVTIENGYGVFNGYDSKLTIPRFTNFAGIRTLVIVVKIDESPPRQQAIVSNYDCDLDPTVLISENATDIQFGIATSEREELISTYVKQSGRSSRDITYTFDNGMLKGSNGISYSFIPASGRLRSVHCSLQIGYANHMPYFQGKIDEITVYLCNPDK